MIYSDGYIIADQWVLIFEHDSKTLFNDSIKIAMEYAEDKIMDHELNLEGSQYTKTELNHNIGQYIQMEINARFREHANTLGIIMNELEAIKTKLNYM